MYPQPQIEQPPQNAPRCWSREYQDLDRECQSCHFKTSCKGAYERASGQAPSPPPLPYPPRSVPLPVYGQPPPQQLRPQVPAAAPTQYQPPQWSPPPPPMAPPRQGQQQAEYNYLGQYPGESVAERVGKNILLRAMEAVFQELTRFFHYFTWPKKPGN